MDNEPKGETLPEGPTLTCRKCNSVEAADQAFCKNCGEPLKGLMRNTGSRKSASGLGSLVDDQHGKHIKRARGAIMVVAVITIIAAVVLWLLLESEIAKIEANPNMYVKQDVVAQQRIAIGATFAIGVVFLALFFWAKSNPFGAALTAFIIYITNIIVGAGIDPKTLPQGILLKIVIIVLLLNGVKSGLAYKKETGH